MSASLPLRLATSALCVLLLAPGAARSESDPLTRAELVEMLKARDAVIVELQQRVRRLERLVEDGKAKAEEPDKGTKASRETASSPRGAAETAARERVSAKEPGQLEVDEGAAARALERTLVREGTLLLPAGFAEVQPSFVYEFNDDDFPSLASVGGGTRAVSNTVERSRYEGRVDLRFGLPLDGQLELGLPYRVVNVEREAAVGGASAGEIATTGSGFGDFEVGAAATFVREGPWWPDVVGRMTWNTGTGEKRSDGVGLGGGFQSLSGSLSFTKRQDPLAFFGSLGYEAVFEDGNVDPGDEYFARVGTALAARRRRPQEDDRAESPSR